MRLRPVELVLLLLMLAGAASARESDRSQPMNLEAEDGDFVLAEDGDTVLTGNVSISQGTLQIAATRATITRNGGEVTRVQFEGNPATLQQENDAGAQVRAKSNRIDYDVQAEQALLTGNVLVDQGGDSLSGQRLTYDMKTSRLKADGQGGGDGRIRMTIQPRAATPDAAADDDTDESP